MGRNDDWQRELGDELKRAATELARGFADHMATHADKARAKHEKTRKSRQQQRIERARARRDEKFADTSLLEGWFHILIALVLLGAAFALWVRAWWLIFIAFAFALKGVRILGYHFEAGRRERLEQPQGLREGEDPRQARIDATCDRLLAALKDAPPSLRSFLSEPEQTVETLRRTTGDLLTREASLRALVQPEDLQRMQQEREDLVRRIAGEPDRVVRERLEAALRTLDANREQQDAIVRSANRLEAEHTRLGYTLDGLYAQVMRLRTADPRTEASATEGLRMSLDGLRSEITALADALEQANLTTSVRAAGGPGVPPPMPEGRRSPRERERS